MMFTKQEVDAMWSENERKQFDNAKKDLSEAIINLKYSREGLLHLFQDDGDPRLVEEIELLYSDIEHMEVLLMKLNRLDAINKS